MELQNAIEESLSEAGATLRALTEAVGVTCDLLRCGEAAEANALWASAIEGLLLMLPTLACFEAEASDGATAQGFEAELGPMLRALEQAQGRSDWLRVADTLEYEVQPLLLRWSERAAELSTVLVRRVEGVGQ